MGSEAATAHLEVEPTSSRIAPLDALRGLAALAIVVFHYVHFLPEGQRPYETWLFWLYARGYHAVALFFILSGYIFFATYADRIASGRLTASQFLILRVSRLYPLHAMTLLLVAALQYLLLRQTGRFFVYEHNTAPYFLANALLVQFGWFGNELTFNGPSWSICVEAYLYLCFFWFARRLASHLPARFIVAAVGLAVMAYGDYSNTGPLNPYMCEGLGCFFCGGCLQAMGALDRRINLGIGCVLIAAGAATIPLVGSRLGLALGVFPGLVLIACASRTFARASQWRLFAWLGNISYSTYLWHFPAQLVFVAFAALVAPLDYSAKPVFWLYVGSVMAAGTLSFHYFEAPARSLIRRWAAEPRTAMASALVFPKPSMGRWALTLRRRPKARPRPKTSLGPRVPRPAALRNASEAP